MALPRNYRPGTDAKDCANCRYLSKPTVFCDRWNEHVDRLMVCNACEPRRTVTVNVKKETAHA